MYKNVYTTGLDYQEMIVLWFLVMRTKVVWYETFKYKMEYVVDTNTHMAYGMLWIQIHIFNNES